MPVKVGIENQNNNHKDAKTQSRTLQYMIAFWNPSPAAVPLPPVGLPLEVDPVSMFQRASEDSKK